MKLGSGFVLCVRFESAAVSFPLPLSGSCHLGVRGGRQRGRDHGVRLLRQVSANTHVLVSAELREGRAFSLEPIETQTRGRGFSLCARIWGSGYAGIHQDPLYLRQERRSSHSRRTWRIKLFSWQMGMNAVPDVWRPPQVAEGVASRSEGGLPGLWRRGQTSRRSQRHLGKELAPFLTSSSSAAVNCRWLCDVSPPLSQNTFHLLSRPQVGDKTLAQSAQMYHYQHRKQQMLSVGK